ncbi:TetR/AcrR family transcriptional regulator [Bordetella sp. BOR01]|uniref:TetR/AcrR family transcriptional regulator n=1 Tax=Bordetella sp. BOR01 TaxID=2854779 RepID=UPI001C4963B7|nr:TetR/AcrR family transcriptional regulator [Bordetella sp. BOR01]MBV7482219.1 TetR/AcrR family transcriptional regulator [Bordetella sp. BOR01]
MANLVPKTPPATWVETAQKALIEEGIHGVKVDRLAQRLGVTRGGFYKHFLDRSELLDQLLVKWENENLFVLEWPMPKSAVEAARMLERLSDRLITEDGFDPRFDLAVRDWARHDKRAAWAVERVDSKRLDLLERLFVAIGFTRDEATVRAKVYYYHQIGYYSMGVKQSVSERKKLMPEYMRIFLGSEHMQAAMANHPVNSKQKKS